MGIINVLPSEIFNRIAAGEVVVKPASIVKELVENSIDAGASRISIEINDGGKEIKVIDDGCGMDEIDISSAFLPHATSKISSLSDLDEISTLGFRGEAIPSIAAVSNVTIISRREEDELGCIVNSVNGHAARPEKCGAKKGTTVHVKDLFKNIPARLKFLRKDKTEENDIISLTDKLILANFNVSFQLIIDGKEVRSSSGKGLNEAVFAVYGRDYLKENDYVNATMSGITLYGYINKPAFSKHNRNFQTLIVNGRYVVIQDISFWIYNSFSSFLMKRQYPAYVLFIDLPADMIDINVHPSKIEIKFIDINTIKKLLSSVIYASLEKGASQPKEITLDKVVEKKEVPIVKEEPAKIESAKIKSSFINAPESRKSFFDKAIKVKSTPEDELSDSLNGNKRRKY
ncbi:MAG: DNA mismatch repair endonuclease MutL [Clostridia bacterium]|nr:DNA mismatch repair endonuclease MutL [Clostridia bacterium]